MYSDKTRYKLPVSSQKAPGRQGDDEGGGKERKKMKKKKYPENSSEWSNGYSIGMTNGRALESAETENENAERVKSLLAQLHIYFQHVIKVHFYEMRRTRRISDNQLRELIAFTEEIKSDLFEMVQKNLNVDVE
jgi:hypothetical protein